MNVEDDILNRQYNFLFLPFVNLFIMYVKDDILRGKICKILFIPETIWYNQDKTMLNDIKCPLQGDVEMPLAKYIFSSDDYVSWWRGTICKILVQVIMGNIHMK